jgi:signal peptidase I
VRTGAAVLAATGAAAVSAARWKFRLVTVTGASMSPTLLAGDTLVVGRCGPRAVRRGDVVLALIPPAGYGASLIGLGRNGREPVPPIQPAGARSGAADCVQDMPDRVVKRVVGMPGDLLLRADLLALMAPGRTVPDALPDSWLIPPHSCFVLGDGDESEDSVAWGPLPLPMVLGRALALRRPGSPSGWTHVPASPWFHA